MEPEEHRRQSRVILLILGFHGTQTLFASPGIFSLPFLFTQGSALKKIPPHKSLDNLLTNLIPVIPPTNYHYNFSYKVLFNCIRKAHTLIRDLKNDERNTEF